MPVICCMDMQMSADSHNYPITSGHSIFQDYYSNEILQLPEQRNEEFDDK